MEQCNKKKIVLQVQNQQENLFKVTSTYQAPQRDKIDCFHEETKQLPHLLQ